jgi:hypothetical protein
MAMLLPPLTGNLRAARNRTPSAADICFLQGFTIGKQCAHLYLVETPWLRPSPTLGLGWTGGLTWGKWCIQHGMVFCSNIGKVKKVGGICKQFGAKPPNPNISHDLECSPASMTAPQCALLHAVLPQKRTLDPPPPRRRILSGWNLNLIHSLQELFHPTCLQESFHSTSTTWGNRKHRK